MADTPDGPYYRALIQVMPPRFRTPNAWATEAGVSRMFFSDAKKGKKPRRETLAKVLAQADWTVDDFERHFGLYPVQAEVRATGPVGRKEMAEMVFGEAPLAPLPLYGSAQGGEIGEQHDFAMTELDLGEVLDHLLRPASLADDSSSYALTIVGTSMVPRFKPGERVGVSPKARVEVGDDVIVQLRGENTNRVRQVLIKELVRRSATHITLAQYNPARELRIERKDILAMHKVKGHFL